MVMDSKQSFSLPAKQWQENGRYAPQREAAWEGIGGKELVSALHDKGMTLHECVNQLFQTHTKYIKKMRDQIGAPTEEWQIRDRYRDKIRGNGARVRAAAKALGPSPTVFVPPHLWAKSPPGTFVHCAQAQAYLDDGADPKVSSEAYAELRNSKIADWTLFADLFSDGMRSKKCHERNLLIPVWPKSIS